MGKKNTDNVPVLSKQTVLIIAVGTFILGFLAGVVITIYKTTSTPSITPSSSKNFNYVKKAKALVAEVMKNPQNTTAWIQLGHIYFETDKYDKAINAYEKALELNPSNADVLTDLGIMYRRSGQPRKAIETFEKAIAIDPKHENARLNKGIVLMHDLKDQNGAIRVWEELLEINPLAMAGKNQSVDQLIKHYREGHNETSPN